MNRRAKEKSSARRLSALRREILVCHKAITGEACAGLVAWLSSHFASFK